MSFSNLPGNPSHLILPSASHFLITPNNNADLPKATRAVSFATAGALHVTTVEGEDITIPDGALAAGLMHPVRWRRVHSTGTTAIGIVGYA